MSEIVSARPLRSASVPAAKLLIVGDPDAAACVGDFCEIPAHHEQSIVNRRLDADEV